MNITPVRIYINGNGSISFYGPNNTLITNLQNLNGAKQSNGQIIFDGDDKTISFYVYQLTSIESATFSLTYSALDSRFFNPSVYSAKLNSVYQDVAQYVLVNKNGGASFVGGVVAVYPNYASFPATGQEAVIYIDEGTNQAYFWDGAAYQLLVSTGVEQYANFASFPVTGSANVIYVDMSVPEPYVWDGAAYQSLSGGSIVWGDITGTLSDQTDLQAALDAKFNNPTGTSSDYLDGTGTPTPFPSIPAQYNPTAGTGINITGSYPNQTITNTAPDQTVSLTAGTNIGVTGTYPNFTISNTQSLAGYVPTTRTLTINGTSQDLSANRTWSVGDMLTSVYDTDVDGVVDSAERIQIVVRNSTGSTLTKGQIVYLSGATGNRPNAVLAQANTEATSSKTIGMVIADIPNNTDGQIAVNGTLHDIDTSAFTAGDTLWLSATTPGGVVANTPPSEPNHTVFIGYVARANPTQGRVVLAIQNGYELDELHGVQITTPTNWQVLRYNSASGLWVNELISASILPGGIDASKIGAGTVDNTEFGYLDGVSSSIQTQLDGKVPTTRSITINGTTQDLSADRTFTIATNPGTVTSVAALTLGTTGTDLSSTVANSTSTPVITLNVPTASATNRGALSAADWSTFNGKQAALVSGTNIKTINSTSVLGSGDIAVQPTLVSGTNIKTINSTSLLGSGNITVGTFTLPSLTNGSVLFSDGTTIAQNNANFFWDNVNNRLGIGTASPGYGISHVGTAGVASFFAQRDFGFNVISQIPQRAYFYGKYTNNLDAGIGIGGNARLNTSIQAFNPNTNTATLLSLNYLGGNVIIGDYSSDAGYKLDVNGTARVQGNAQFGNGFYWDNTNGRLGIGTASPAYGVDIAGAVGAASSIRTGWGVYSRYLFNPTATATWIEFQPSTHQMQFTINGTEAIRIPSTRNVLIGTTTDVASSKLTVESTTQGFLPPRMTTTQKNAIASPIAGLVVYDTTLNKLCVRGASAWETITSI